MNGYFKSNYVIKRKILLTNLKIFEYLSCCTAAKIRFTGPNCPYLHHKLDTHTHRHTQGAMQLDKNY